MSPTGYWHVTDMLVCVCGKTCRPIVGRQSANSGPTESRQSTDSGSTGFLGALLHIITELSFLCMDSNWVNFQQYSKRMSHLLHSWMTKTISICSFISWGGFKFKSSIDQNYQRYGAYYDKRKKKLDFHYQPRNKVEGREKEFQTSSQSSLECLPRTQSAASANSPRILRESRFHQGELQSITALFLLAGSSVFLSSRALWKAVEANLVFMLSCWDPNSLVHSWKHDTSGGRI